MWFGISGLLIVGLFIYTAVLVHRNGQTIAKKLLNIKVVRTDGSKAGLGRIFWLRNVVIVVLSVIPVLGVLVSLVDPLFIFRDNRRCLHDLIADTKVVRA
jgi:uncharacterized RDD family membrane protein YckC